MSAHLEQRAREVLEEHTEIPLPWMRGYVQVQQGDVMRAMLAFAAEQIAQERERCARVCDDVASAAHLADAPISAAIAETLATTIRTGSTDHD